MIEFKNCPFCGEEILAEANKCKHCGEWLIDRSSETINEITRLQLSRNNSTRNDGGTIKNTQPVISSQLQPIVNVYTTIPAKPQRNGIGLTGFILSLLCLMTSWAPGVNILMWILGFVFSAVGMFKKPKGFAIAGMVISLISILLIVLFLAVLGELVNELLNEF